MARVLPSHLEGALMNIAVICSTLLGSQRPTWVQHKTAPAGAWVPRLSDPEVSENSRVVVLTQKRVQKTHSAVADQSALSWQSVPRGPPS